MDSRQQQAVEHGEGPLLIVAGPGSGKTYTLVSRIAYLITNYDCSVLGLTYTKKAADEIYLRSGSHKNVWTGTIHSFCYHLIRGLTQNNDFLNINSKWQLLEDTTELWKKACGDIPIALVKTARNLKYPSNPLEKELWEAGKRYANLLKQKNALDFDILLELGYKALCDPVVSTRLSKKYRFVLIDEFQDCNKLQYNIIKKLSKNLTVVGDDDQAIFKFQGAEAHLFASFLTDFPNTKLVKLGTNYRSAQEIIDLSEKLIGKKKGGGLTREGIAQLLSFNTPKDLVPWIRTLQSPTILCRAGWHILRWEALLIQAGIGYTLTRGKPLLERESCLAMLRQKDIPFFLKSLKEPSKDEEILYDLTQYWGNNKELYKHRPGTIFISTIHSFKGKEADVVVVSDVEDGSIPYFKSYNHDWNVEEEKRLLYVAITRAKKELYVTRVLVREKPTQTSPFWGLLS